MLMSTPKPEKNRHRSPFIARGRKFNKSCYNMSSSHKSTNNCCLPRIIVLNKGAMGKGLGFTIVGGSDSPKGAIGFFVKQVYEDGVAYVDGNLKEGDEIIAVNDTVITGMIHSEGVNCFKRLPKGLAKFVIKSKLCEKCQVAKRISPNGIRRANDKSLSPVSIMRQGGGTITTTAATASASITSKRRDRRRDVRDLFKEQNNKEVESPPLKPPRKKHVSQKQSENPLLCSGGSSIEKLLNNTSKNINNHSADGDRRSLHLSSSSSSPPSSPPDLPTTAPPDLETESIEAEKVIIYRQSFEKIGMGVRIDSSTDAIETVEKVIVHSLASDGAVAKSGRVKEDQELVELQSIPLKGLRRSDVLQMLRDLPQIIEMKVMNQIPETENHDQVERVLENDELCIVVTREQVLNTLLRKDAGGRWLTEGGSLPRDYQLTEINGVIIQSYYTMNDLLYLLTSNRNEVIMKKHHLIRDTARSSERSRFGSIKFIHIDKSLSPLGFTLFSNDNINSKSGPRIKMINVGSQVDGLLEIGDELIKMNEYSTLGLSRGELWSLLKSMPTNLVRLTIRRL